MKMKQINEYERKWIEIQCDRNEELWIQSEEISEVYINIDSYNWESINEKNRDNNIEICKYIINIEKYIHWEKTNDDYNKIS